MWDGEVDSSVGLAQGLSRTLKDHVEHKIGQRLDAKSSPSALELDDSVCGKYLHSVFL